MIKELFSNLLVQPLYNALVGIAGVLPQHDFGLSIIILTVVIRTVLVPIFSKTIRMQAALKRLEPELAQINKAHKDNAELRARKTMELYRTHRINPFSTIGALFIQLPIFLALYFVFLRDGLPVVDQAFLYPFLSAPYEINALFLGVVDVTARHHILLALLVGISQYAQIRLSPLGAAPATPSDGSFKGDLAKSYRLQLLYGLPVLIAYIGYTLPAAASLYWITNNVFSIVQEKVVRKRLDTELASAGENEHTGAHDAQRSKNAA